jgi:hypothetical protein
MCGVVQVVEENRTAYALRNLDHSKLCDCIASCSSDVSLSIFIKRPSSVPVRSWTSGIIDKATKTSLSFSYPHRLSGESCREQGQRYSNELYIEARSSCVEED